jgi:hypothetical protein
MATKTPKTSTVKSKPAAPPAPPAPKFSRARKNDPMTIDDAQSMRDQIAQRAYERFIARGYQHGHDLEDWLGAERELTQPQ